MTSLTKRFFYLSTHLIPHDFRYLLYFTFYQSTHSYLPNENQLIKIGQSVALVKNSRMRSIYGRNAWENAFFKLAIIIAIATV